MYRFNYSSFLLQATLAVGAVIGTTRVQMSYTEPQTSKSQNNSITLPATNTTVDHDLSASLWPYNALLAEGVEWMQHAYPDGTFLGIDLKIAQPGNDFLHQIAGLNLFWYQPGATRATTNSYTLQATINPTGYPEEWRWPPLRVITPPAFYDPAVTWPLQIDPWEAVQLTRDLSHGQPRFIGNIHLQTYKVREPLGVLQIYRILDADVQQEWCLRTDRAILIPDCNLGVLALFGANSSAQGSFSADA